MSQIRSGSAAINVPNGLWVSGGYEGGPLKDSSEIGSDLDDWIEGKFYKTSIFSTLDPVVHLFI